MMSWETAVFLLFTADLYLINCKMCTKTKEIRLLLSRQIQADIKLTKADMVFAESCHELTASGLKKIEVLHPLCSEMRESWRRHPNQFNSPYAVTDSDDCLRK